MSDYRCDNCGQSMTCKPDCPGYDSLGARDLRALRRPRDEGKRLNERNGDPQPWEYSK